MTTPFFSIITVNLNSGQLLERTYASVVKQNITDYEYIIKDGMSTDGSTLFLSNTGLSHRLLSKRDEGIYDAMNQALDIIRGKYILFLNAGDEFYDEDVLKRIMHAYQQKPELKLVYSDYICRNSPIKYRSPGKLYGYTMFRNMLCHQVTCISASLLQGNKFDTNYRVAADYDLFLRLAKGGIEYKYLPFVSVIMLPGGFSSQNSQLSEREVKDIRKRHFGTTAKVYSFINAMTLPALRNRIAAIKGFESIYRIVANIVNRYI